VPRDASGFAEQEGISISYFVNPALFRDFNGEVAWSVTGTVIFLVWVAFL
jgi:hypothetical protein